MKIYRVSIFLPLYHYHYTIIITYRYYIVKFC
nr:MAG TPA: hypothetical protein [Caudoviricetes sp.]